nr:sensor domain-containing diguanylate cyclase [Thaumasiovibrio subtropicus]
MELQYTESERVIRRLYEITNAYDKGFQYQIRALLAMGLERFNLDIAILSRIEGDKYVVEHTIAPPDIPLRPGDTFELGKTYCSVTCEANSPVAIERVGESDALGTHPAYQAFGLESYVGIPVRCKGELYGTLNFSSATPYPRQFNEIDIDSLNLMASWIGVELIRLQQETELQLLNQKLVEQASTDSLTRLPNRRSMFKYLRKEVNRINRNSQLASLVLIDIDFFKKLNDKYGHQVGDEVLYAVAQSIKNTLRDYDFVARYGGEEFLVWLPETTQLEVENACRRVMNNIADIDIVDEMLTVSMGICHFKFTQHLNTDTDTLIDTMVAHADSSLYKAKAEGRNRFHQYELDDEKQLILPREDR